MDNLKRLRGGLIASCQPVRGGVFDEPDLVARFALAALTGGAAGLRVESLADVRAVRAATAPRHGTAVPLVGLIKVSAPPEAVFITTTIAAAEQLVAAGANIVAFDASDRQRSISVAAMVAAIHQLGALAMADVATLAEGRVAHAAGADFVASTLSGYTSSSAQQRGPDLELVRALSAHGARVVAEGRIADTVTAAAAIAAGAYAVTIGTAFSRPESIVRSFVEALPAMR